MPSSSMKKKPIATLTTTTTAISRPSLIDTMLMTSTPLRKSPVPPIQPTRSTANVNFPTIFKERNQIYEDMKLLNLAKSSVKKEKKTPSVNKDRKKRSRSKKSMVPSNSKNLNNDDDDEDDDDEETENDEDSNKSKKTNSVKRKTHRSKNQQQTDEPITKRLRRTSVLNEKRNPKKIIGKSSAGSSDGCTTVDEENEETRLIEQSKLYIEGPGVRSNFKKIREHNSKIEEKLQNLHGNQIKSHTLPSPILTHSINPTRQETNLTSTQSSPIKVKTGSRITFALPPSRISPLPAHLFESTNPSSPQMPPTTTTASICIQTDAMNNRLFNEEQCQTESVDIEHRSIQTDSTLVKTISVAVQCQQDSNFNEQHHICRDLTSCACVEQLVKTRQFLVETTNKFQSISNPTNPKTTKLSKQTMTVDELSSNTMVLAKSSLRSEQQIIFDQFLTYFNIRYSPTIDESTTHLITDSIDENSPFVCPLTLKVIQATARHLPIISIQWLVASLTHQIIVPSHIYEIFLGDPTYGYHGGFLRSRIPRSQGLFQGISFRLECPEEHGCSVLLADNRALRELIHLCGGLIVDDSNANTNSSATIIVLCNEIKRKDQISTAYVKPEWLLASIAQYNLQPFQHFPAHLST